jgi:hypothetical protein
MTRHHYAGAKMPAQPVFTESGWETSIQHKQKASIKPGAVPLDAVAVKRHVPIIHPIFYLAETADVLTFYINAAAWVDGHRQAMRSECVTSLRSHNALSINIEPARFREAPESRVEIDVAAVD